MPSLVIQSVGADVLLQVSHMMSGSIERNRPDTEIRESFSIAVLHMVLCAIERHPPVMKVVVLHWCCLKRG